MKCAPIARLNQSDQTPTLLRQKHLRKAGICPPSKISNSNIKFVVSCGCCRRRSAVHILISIRSRRRRFFVCFFFSSQTDMPVLVSISQFLTLILFRWTVVRLMGLSAPPYTCTLKRGRDDGLFRGVSSRLFFLASTLYLCARLYGGAVADTVHYRTCIAIAIAQAYRTLTYFHFQLYGAVPCPMRERETILMEH